MDYKQLLQLAGENSQFAKKKHERLISKQQGEFENVSSTAVAKYLNKQRQLKEKQQAKEEEARKQRVKARLEASLNKKKPRSSTTENAKVLQERDKRTKTSSKLERDKSKQVERRVEKQVEKTAKHHRSSIPNKATDKQDKQDVKVAKRKNRVKEKRKPDKGGGLSFTELMKLAKHNSDHAGTTPKTLKRKPEKLEETSFDPDRHLKSKVRKKEKYHQQSVLVTNKNNSNKIHNIQLDNRKSSKKDKSPQKQFVKEKPAPLTNPYKDLSRPVKRGGLIMETVSTTQTYSPVQKISDKFKQVKPTRERGIAAQSHFASKHMKHNGKGIRRTAQDMESEFEKEERALERKRKLFEMRRITGNKHIQEEDLFDDDEDYDLDEEDEEDADFIDDSETVGDVSRHIRSIFGYDKRRFHDSDDEDLRNMESNFSQIQKEEARSARIARIEDAYEKMQEEEEELKRLKRNRLK